MKAHRSRETVVSNTGVREGDVPWGREPSRINITPMGVASRRARGLARRDTGQMAFPVSEVGPAVQDATVMTVYG